MASPATRPAGPRWTPLVAAAVLCAGVGVAVGVLLRPAAPPTQVVHSSKVTAAAPVASAPAAAKPAAQAVAAPTPHPPAMARQAPPPPAIAEPAKPSFDVVRVTPDGRAVIAGRAFPGSTVIVRDGTAEIGRAQADANGAWVLVPDKPLGAGSHNLTIAAIPVQGGKAVAGTGSVVVAVAAQSGQPKAALAVATAANAPSRVLEGGGTAKPGQLGLQTLDYDQKGRIRLSGTAPPGARVEVYAGKRALGQAVAGADGRWSLTPQAKLAPGQHVLRLDQIGRTGQVARRIELPFKQENFAGSGIAPGSVVVQPGQSLWRIAQATYGAGTRYTLIFNANRAEIRDPNLIYPGQVFGIPPASPALEPKGAAGR